MLDASELVGCELAGVLKCGEQEDVKPAALIEKETAGGVSTVVKIVGWISASWTR